MFVFTLVRNPWDRVVSYYHWLQTQSFDHPAVTRAKALDFSGFLNHPGTGTSLQAAHYASYVTDRLGEEQECCFIRLEHLGPDMAPLAAHLGFMPVLPRANASARQRDWRPYYTDRDAALVAGICARDVARFGYAFDDPMSPQSTIL